MTTTPESVLPILERTPRVLDALLRGLPDAWALANEGPDTWAPKQIVTHYLHTDQHNWLPRLQLILEADPASPTPPTFANMSRVHDSIDPNTLSLTDLLDRFTDLRCRNLAALHALHLRPADLTSTAIHPTFGEVTLGNLLATWAAHDLTHLHQLSRTLAYQLRDDVGPWTAFLGVLHCTAHSN